MPQTAQQRIQELFHNAVTDTGLVHDFDLFHSSVSQKLWSAGYHCKQLRDLDIGQFQVLPPPSDTQSYGSTLTIPTPMLDIGSYCNHLNLYLDGFFMNAMSTLDTLAHEIFVLYKSRTISSRIYIYTARDMLRDIHPTSSVRALIDTELGKIWFGEFEPFRHCTTHESLIRHDDIVYRFDPVARRYKLSRRVKLPDNPQMRPFTYDHNRLANEYIALTFKRINRLVSDIYRNVLRDISAARNALPIHTP